jgi:hypothetical protein
LDACFPFKTIRIRSTDPPWVKHSLKLLIDRRDRAFSLRQMAKYKRLRNEVIVHVRKLKLDYLNSASSSSNPRLLWKSLRSVSRHSKSSVSDRVFSPDVFASYFSSNFQSNDVDSLSFDIDCLPDNEVVLSVHEVQVYLSKLQRKSCGPDGIPFWVFKNWSTVLSPAITRIFNLSLRHGIVPSCFKVADVKPIPKCSNPSDVSSFRPISLLPLLSKVLEKIVRDRLILPHVRNKLDADQFAYVPRCGGGTATALTLVYHQILRFLDSAPGCARVLTVDFSKAFDKILHASILQSCVDFKLPAQAFRWIASFLSGRLQRVRLDGVTSGWSVVTSGVPQGSVLGPLLFCIVTDSLRAVCHNTKVVKYADDVTFIHLLRRRSDDQLQLEWNHCVDWSDNHGLPINVNKCFVMDIITSRSLSVVPVATSVGFLPSVTSIQLLGVTFSSNLKWNDHISKSLCKASKRIFLLRNLRRAGCPPGLIFKAYTAFIRPILLYAFPCWCNIPQYLQKKLDVVERRAIRIIGEVDSHKTLSEAAESMCLKLFSQVERHCEHPLRVLFEPRRSSMTRRQCSLKRPLVKTKRFSSSFIKYCT